MYVPRSVSTGKCAGKSSVTRTSTRGNTLLPSTLTLLIGLRVTHSWGCVLLVGVGVSRARTRTRNTNRFYDSSVLVRGGVFM